jgi:hypothetical protein
MSQCDGNQSINQSIMHNVECVMVVSINCAMQTKHLIYCHMICMIIVGDLVVEVLEGGL